MGYKKGSTKENIRKGIKKQENMKEIMRRFSTGRYAVISGGSKETMVQEGGKEVSLDRDAKDNGGDQGECTELRDIDITEGLGEKRASPGPVGQTSARGEESNGLGKSANTENSHHLYSSTREGSFRKKSNGEKKGA